MVTNILALDGRSIVRMCEKTFRILMNENGMFHVSPAYVSSLCSHTHSALKKNRPCY
jgi:hypothetical protein